MEMLMKFCSPFVFFDSGQNLLLSNYTFFFSFFFSITPKDGRIFTHGELDREEIENYEILVVAQDNGSPPLSGETFMDIGQTDRQTDKLLFKVNWMRVKTHCTHFLGMEIVIRRQTDGETEKGRNKQRDKHTNQ